MDSRRDARWWRDELEGRRHEAVTAQVTDLETRHADRLCLLRCWYALYRDETYEDYLRIGIDRRSRSRDNVVQNGIDSVHARLTKNRPKPWIVTVGGEWSAQDRAKQASKYLEGEFARLDVYKTTSSAALDSLVFGDGMVKVFRRRNRPMIERVWVGELLVDPTEAKHNSVRTLYQIKLVDKDVLKERYPDFRVEIERATRFENLLRGTWEREGEITSDMAHVIEAWHLPSRDEVDDDETKSDGRHVICTDTATLADEEWSRDHFPFAKLPWAEDPLGYWSQGLAERMCGSQAEIDHDNAIVSECFDRTVPSVWVADQARINREIIDNDPVRVYRFSNAGSPPIFMASAPVSDQHLVRLEKLKQDAYANQGISELSARSEKPAGLNSGRALRIHHDIEAARFSKPARAWETFHVDIARLVLEVADDIASDDDVADSDLTVYVGKDALESIRYADARLRDAPYDVRVFPASSLSSTPEGKLQDVQDLIGLGVITDPNDIRDLLDFPDLDRYNTVESAGRRLSDKIIEAALKGEVSPANEYLPLPYAHKRAVLTYSLAKLDGAPESSLKRLEALIAHIEELIRRAANPPPAAAMPGSPMALPPPVPPGSPSPMPPTPMTGS